MLQNNILFLQILYVSHSYTLFPSPIIFIDKPDEYVCFSFAFTLQFYNLLKKTNLSNEEDSIRYNQKM